MAPAHVTCAVLALSSFAGAAYPSPEPIMGTRPGALNSTLDPGLIRRESDGKYFLYTTPADLTVFTANSLSGPWIQESDTALYNIANLGTGNHGAPTMHNIDRTYYLYFNGHDPSRPSGHDGKIGVATSTTSEPGSWSFHGYLDITWRNKYGILDPSLLPKDESRNQSQHLLAFGSYREGIFDMPLADPPTAIQQGANNEISSLARNQSAETQDIEGGYLFHHKSFYYVFFSSGECCKKSGDGSDPADWQWSTAGQAYKIMVCRSQNATSGFVDRQGRDCLDQSGGTEVLASHDNVWAPDGQGVMYDEEAGGVILYYHYVIADRKNDQDFPYRFGWNKLDFGNDHWPVVVSTAT